MTHTLAAPLAAYMVTGGMLFLVAHWLRRVLWKPASGLGRQGSVTMDTSSRAFDRIQRLFHWVLTVTLVLTAFSGLALYSPAFFDPLTEMAGFSIHSNILLLVDLHVASVVILGASIAIHIGWDFYMLRTWRLIRNGRKDFTEFSSRARGLISGAAVEFTKQYDVFMKSFHTTLIVLFLGLGFTGLVMYFIAPWWLYPQLLHSAIEPWWMPTPIHDVLGFLLLILVISHTYFSLLRTNRPILKSMVTGQASSVSSPHGERELQGIPAETRTDS